MRVTLKGISRVRKKLADGTIKIFYYAWKSGPPLRGEPGPPEFHGSYNEAVATKVKTPTGQLSSILLQYKYRKISAGSATARSAAMCP